MTWLRWNSLANILEEVCAYKQKLKQQQNHKLFQFPFCFLHSHHLPPPFLLATCHTRVAKYVSHPKKREENWIFFYVVVLCAQYEVIESFFSSAIFCFDDKNEQSCLESDSHVFHFIMMRKMKRESRSTRWLSFLSSKNYLFIDALRRWWWKNFYWCRFLRINLAESFLNERNFFKWPSSICYTQE